ncbi:MAG: InlB B-repeat-containing protein [Clostridia bacterium]|nr:InlB B-repeat-containing protein [Clostridia bacterium]
MWSCLGLVIYYGFIGAVKLGKLALKGLFYTLPIWLAFAGFFLGGLIGGNKFGDMKEDYIYEQAEEFTHTVTIYCDYESNPNQTATLKIREDLNWYIFGSLGTDRTDDYLYYEKDAPKDITLPPYTQKEGYKFIGLFDNPYGGNQYVSAGGYSLKRVTKNVTLYALFEEV